MSPVRADRQFRLCRWCGIYTQGGACPYSPSCEHEFREEPERAHLP